MTDVKNIRMPSTPRSAYDPKRPANMLLINHVRELEKAVKQAGRGVKSKKPRTEGQVAAYMRHLNRALHQQILLPKTMKRRPLDVPLAGNTAPSGFRARPPRRKRKPSVASARKKGVRSKSKRNRRS
jgi:hypothetical protein